MKTDVTMNFIFNKRLDEFKKLIEAQKSKITGLASVKGGHSLIEFGILLVRLAGAKAPSKADVRYLRAFFKEVFKLVRCSGLSYTIKYLKTCSVMMQQYVARDTTRPHSRQVGGVAVAVTRRGLPRIIPREVRLRIRKSDTVTITL